MPSYDGLSTHSFQSGKIYFFAGNGYGFFRIKKNIGLIDRMTWFAPT
jgi:hypothetical protein